MKKRAFTLAEVLITLGIIGVVAAMTLPSLIQKYQENVLVTRAKKTYSVLMNGLNAYSTDLGLNGDFSVIFDYTKTSDEIAEGLSKYFNGSKYCVTKDNDNCIPYYPIKLLKARNNGSGKNEVRDLRIGPTIVLNNGAVMSIKLDSQSDGCYYQFTYKPKDENGDYIPDGNGGVVTEIKTNQRCGQIALDTNGTQGPNRIGSDVFFMEVGLNKIVQSKDIAAGDITYLLQYDKVQPYENYDANGDFKD